MIILDATETRACLPLPALVDAVSAALVAIAEDRVSAPPRIAAFAPGGLLGAMPAYLPGAGLGAKLVSVFESGAVTSHRGVVCLFDPDDGRPTAIVDAESLTAVRTAASATVAMRALARPDRRRIAVLGAGAQARAQVEVLAALGESAPVLGVRDRTVVPTDLAHLEVTDIRSAVAAADVVLCATSARSPVVGAGWLAPGVHLGSVGGSAGHEVAADCVDEGRVFVEWAGAAEQPPPAGAHELQPRDGGRPVPVELIGDVLSGRAPGRGGLELTLFKSTGHAALDVAAAALAVATAAERGAGRTVAL